MSQYDIDQHELVCERLRKALLDISELNCLSTLDWHGQFERAIEISREALLEHTALRDGSVWPSGRKP